MPSTITTVGAGPVTPAPFHEQRRQGDALVGHLDELDVRIPHPDAGVIAAVSAPAPGALLLAREDEALGVVEIIAGPQIIVTGARLASFRRGGIGALLDKLGDSAPLLLQGVRLLLAQAQLLAGAVHLLERHHAVGRHPLDDQGRVRPQEIIAEMVDPGTSGHARVLLKNGLLQKVSGRRSRCGRC
jgi:hypothetical protein